MKKEIMKLGQIAGALTMHRWAANINAQYQTVRLLDLEDVDCDRTSSLVHYSE